jgi:hypothetical protein
MIPWQNQRRIEDLIDTINEDVAENPISYVYLENAQLGIPSQMVEIAKTITVHEPTRD